MKQGDLLFVYGTLRRGQRADLSRNRGLTFVGMDAIGGRIYDLGSFPGFKTESTIHDPEMPEVIGDVFCIDDESVVAQLDGYEGYPSLYDRQQVLTATGRIVWVYTYQHSVSEASRVFTGDWSTRQLMAA